MNDLTTTTILLILGVVILWMAVTDKLGRLLDAWDVVIGKSTATTASASGVSNPLMTPTHFALPSLPTNAALTNPQVPSSMSASRAVMA